MVFEYAGDISSKNKLCITYNIVYDLHILLIASIYGHLL